MDYRDVATICVHCGTNMFRERLSTGHTLERCAGCGGGWMETAEFLALWRHAQPSYPLDELLEHDDGSDRRPCPRCGEAMTIAWIDLLQLDQCPLHGVWFDAGELERALRGEIMPRLIGPRPPRGRGGGGLPPVGVLGPRRST